MGLAFREFQLAMRDDQADGVALERLAEHYQERGDAVRAASLFERLLQTNPAHQPWLQSLAELLRGRPSGSRFARPSSGPWPPDCPRIERPSCSAVVTAVFAKRLTALHWRMLLKNLCRRRPTLTASASLRVAVRRAEDVYARQWHRPADGQTGYTPVHEPLTPAGSAIIFSVYLYGRGLSDPARPDGHLVCRRPGYSPARPR